MALRRGVAVGPGRGAVVDAALGAARDDVGDRRALALAPLRLAAAQLGVARIELALAGVEALVAGGQIGLAATQVLVTQAGLLVPTTMQQ